MAQVWPLHPEKSNNRTGRRKISLGQIPAPALISCIAVQTWANSSTPNNLFPQLIIVPTPLSTMRGGTKEWDALSVWHLIDACTSFWCRKEGRKEITSVSYKRVVEISLHAASSLSWCVELRLYVDNSVAFLLQNFSVVSNAIVKNLTALFNVKLNPEVKLVKLSSNTSHWTKLLNNNT